MNPVRTLLFVWHSRTGTAHAMTKAAVHGAQQIADTLNAADSVRIIARHASKTQARHLLEADTLVFCAPENLGSVSGVMKEFFDRNYYDCLDRLNGTPFALMVAAGSDGQGAVRQIERICTGWRLRSIAPPLVIGTSAQTPQAIAARKTLTPEQRQRCEELGGTLAALLIQ
ncbi:MAG: flavodoxin family protein [Alcaligenaceae bacterium]|nr:flavodoxin family protein [Alcaligenaceae bacterium]